MHAKNKTSRAHISTPRSILICSYFQYWDVPVPLRSIHWLKLGWIVFPRWEEWAGQQGALWGWWGSWCGDTVHRCTCGHTPPRFLCQAMERDGHSVGHNGHFSAERERLWQGTMGPFREVVLPLPGPALGLCSQHTFIRLVLSQIRGRSLCTRPRGRATGTATIHPIDLSHRELSAAEGRRSSSRGQTITQHYSVICNEPGLEKLNWADTICDSKMKHKNKNGHSNSITYTAALLCSCFVSPLKNGHFNFF